MCRCSRRVCIVRERTITDLVLRVPGHVLSRESRSPESSLFQWEELLVEVRGKVKEIQCSGTNKGNIEINVRY